MSNTAQDVIWPKVSSILARVVFLYVGQGDSTLVMARDATNYNCLLVDINLDKENRGINVPAFMSDLLDGKEASVIFMNTHPHNDHLCGVESLSDEVDLDEIWHSGHKPGKKHDDAYQALQRVIHKIEKSNGSGAIKELLGSRSVSRFGEVDYFILAPAEYVKDDIADEDPDSRYRRIHEHCAVIRVGKDQTWALLAGDADRDAWEKHITEYHRTRLKSQVLGAAHHGSRTFFKYSKDDAPYTEALDAIDPEYVVLSAPPRADSPHDHPHEDAVDLYEDRVGHDNILHTGQNQECFIFDIYDDGSYEIWTDTRLVDAYGFGNENNRGKGAGSAGPAIITGTRVDDRPMGQ